MKRHLVLWSASVIIGLASPLVSSSATPQDDGRTVVSETASPVHAVKASRAHVRTLQSHLYDSGDTPAAVDRVASTALLGSSAAQSSPRHPELNHNLKAPQAYSAGVYHPPLDYMDHRWSFGDRLPAAYFVRRYWLSDFAEYGLFTPPDGLRWVRVGTDALLIDPYTGDVVQVDYWIFQ